MSTIGKQIHGVGTDREYKEPLSPLMYLRYELDASGSFMQEWKTLNDASKEWYRKAAIEEMEANGIPMK